MAWASVNHILIGTSKPPRSVFVTSDSLVQIAPSVIASLPLLLPCPVLTTLSVEICPKGDDPATDNQNYRIIVLTVTGELSFSGSLGVSFQGEKTLIDLPATSAEAVRALLEASQKFGEVKVDYSSSHTTVSTHTFTFTFLSWPTLPKENNLYTHTAAPPLSEFTCDTSLMDASIACQFADVQSSYLRGRRTFSTPLIAR
jgi:hypothetical protein